MHPFLVDYFSLRVNSHRPSAHVVVDAAAVVVHLQLASAAAAAAAAPTS